jgi:hypothetical protein
MNSIGSGLELEIIDREGSADLAKQQTPLHPQILALNFANKWRSLSLYSSLAD